MTRGGATQAVGLGGWTCLDGLRCSFLVLMGAMTAFSFSGRFRRPAQGFRVTPPQAWTSGRVTDLFLLETKKHRWST